MEKGNVSRRKFLTASMITTGAVIPVMVGARNLFGDVLEACGLTPPQTEGPFFPVSSQADEDNDLTVVKGKNPTKLGEIIYLNGVVQGEDCLPVKGALIEIWQACASGRYNHPNDMSGNPLDPDFQYWGKAISDEKGRYSFKTVRPGHYVADTNWTRPPHIHFKVMALGYRDLTTQMYFDGNSFGGDVGALINDLNDKDLILRDVPADERSRVLVPFAPVGTEVGYTGSFAITMVKVRS